MRDEPDDEEGARDAAIALAVFGACFAILGVLSRSLLPFMAAEALLGLALTLLIAK